jgi:hypothetical protein
MPLPDQLVDTLVSLVLDRKIDVRSLSDSELLAVSHVFLDEDCCLPPTEAVFDEVERRGLSGEK